MIDFMNRLREGALVPALRTELQQTEQRLQSTRETLAHTEISLQKLERAAVAWDSERQALADEKKALAQQLSQVQAHLERMYLHSQSEISQLSREKDTISEVRSKELQQLVDLSRELASTQLQLEKTKQVNAALAQEKNILETAARARSADLQSIADEKKELLRQLNIAQEEIKSLHFDNQQRAAKFEQEKSRYAAEKAHSERELAGAVQQLAASRAQMNQVHQALVAMTKSRDELTGQVEQSATRLAEIGDALSIAQAKSEALAKSNQQLTDELQEQRKSLIDFEYQAKAHARTLTEQNSLMQRQLHEIQTELEQYYLANREMQAVMANSARAMHRARGMLTKTMLND